MKKPFHLPHHKLKQSIPMNPHISMILAALGDAKLPHPHRSLMLRELLSEANPHHEQIAQEVLDKIAENSQESVYREKLRQLEGLLKELQEGPMRMANFIELAQLNGAGAAQALVVLDDGTQAFVVVPDTALAQKLRAGDRVILDGKARVLFHSAPTSLTAGEEARMERRIDDRYVEVTIRGDERLVVLAAADLMDQIKAARVAPGAILVVNLRQAIAFNALPCQNGLSHFKYLDRGPIPDVTVERHIGSPPRVIFDVANHVRQELTHPEARRRYGLRPCIMRLLCGASGSGKTLAIQAIIRLVYETASEVTGVPMHQLPPRVLRLRQSQLLSMWLGESDKNIDRFFDEIEELAKTEFTTPDGRRVQLPCICIIEEADGVGRARNEDALYGRILTTLLQRLDPNREGLRDHLVIFLATTNEPQVVDPAFLRRVGGQIETFGRLSRNGFRSVLNKLVHELPAASNNGCTQEEIWKRMTDDLTAWLFSPNDISGVVELTFAGSTTPVIKYRRDFLTGALVDRAVQQAAAEACWLEDLGGAPTGITLEQLMRAIHRQVLGLVAQLREQNVGHYTDLPDGVRVASLRRIPQPVHLPIEFQRDSNN
jgi:ATP-dependent 26S proteasome regulatory subunit